MAQKKTSKAFGRDNERERVRYYKERFPPPDIVIHSRGSFGQFDIVVQHFPDRGNISALADEPFYDGYETFNIDVKTGGKYKVAAGRREFEKNAREIPIVPHLHLLFDSRIRGSGVWTSESYPGDFEEE